MNGDKGAAVVLTLFVWGLAGLVSGLAAGGLLALGLKLIDAEVGMLGLTAGVVALAGGLFPLSGRWLASTSSRWCPQTVSAPIVAGMIAAVVGASIWSMGGTTANAPDAATKDAIDEVLSQVPSGFLGGMLGGGYRRTIGAHGREPGRSPPGILMRLRLFRPLVCP